jgi:predicted transcriptional regulator
MAVSVKLDNALKSRIQQLTGQRQRSAHRIMREAIQQYVEREEARESLTQEALAPWAKYQTSPQHLTGDEVRHWLLGWGSQCKAQPPACHD